MNNYNQALDILNIKDNLGYYLGRYVALIRNYPNIVIDDQENSLMMKELGIESLEISNLKNIFSNRDQIFFNQYIIGYLDIAPFMSYPYDIPYVEMKNTEMEFLNDIFSDFEYPQNILLYHQKYLESKNKIFQYKKLIPEALDPILDEDNFYDLYGVATTKKENNIEYITTGLSLAPPPGYYFQIFTCPELLDSGYISLNNIIITKQKEVIIPLLNVYEEEKQTDFPLLIGKMILKKV